ncbi:S-layer protein [Paenibacillus oralis]|uniref:S-layer protein n=1 Tax=Paenibacillus oralis TaxID=2490856 RepID=A0A3P3TEY1_9BACL|nr:fibronectin type III domain-containing protein [Paenibacillus oralis]RRJ54973.1 S-layer protein [Paenibacillus oralis]
MGKVLLAVALLSPPLASTGLLMPSAYAAAVDNITVVSDTATLKAVQSSVVKVEMTDKGRYRIILLPNTNVFYGSGEGNVSTILDYNGTTINFNSLPLNYFRINNNVIEMSRQKDSLEFILRVSIVNATSLGAYMKVELEAVNRSGGNQNLGGTFYWDTKVNDNDGSPFEVIPNGWRNYSGGVQVTAFYANTYNVVDADRIWMGQYSNPDNASLSGGSSPSYYTVGQKISASDTAAQFWWNQQTVSNGASRKFSTIVGIGPQNTPPSFTLSSPASGQTFYKGQSLQITGTTKDSDVGDVLTVKWSIDGGPENILNTLTADGSNQQFTMNYTLPTNMSDGAHTLQVWVMDDKGGVSSVSNVNFTVKSFVIPGQPVFNATQPNGFDISWDKKENDASVTYELLNSTTNQTINTGTANSTTVTGLTPNTSYSFVVRAKNSSGEYTSYSPVSNLFTLANAPASASITQSGNSPHATWSANGNPTGTTYKYELRDQGGAVVKSGTTTSTSTSIPLDGVPDGRYNLFVCAINGNGISTTYASAGQVLKDTTAPTAPGVSIAPSTWTNSSATVTITHGTDNLSGVQKSQYKIGSAGTWVDYTTPFTISTEGLQDVYARTFDNFGNISSVASSTALIDKTAPMQPSISLNPLGWTSSSVTVTITPGSDTLSGVLKTQYKIGPGGSWADYTAPITISAEGLSDVYARTIDYASNVSSEATVTAKIDKTAPSAPAITLSDSNWSNKDVTFTISSGADNGSGVAKNQYKIGAGAWVDYTGIVTISTEGQTDIYARTVDNVGNISTQTVARALIDKTPPSDPQVLLSESTWTQKPVTFSIGGSSDVNPITYEYKINGGDYKVGTSGTISENGVTTITVRASDSVGNISNEISKKIYVDAVDPFISIGPNTQDWTDKDVKVTINYSDEHSGVDPNKRFYKVTSSPNLPTSWETATSNNQEVMIQSEGVWYVHAKVEDLAGNTFQTTSSEIRLQRMPQIPVNLRVTQVTEKTAQLTFDLPAGVLSDGYQYEVKNSTTGKSWLLDHPSNTITDLSLEGDHAYEYQVRAINHVGSSPFGNSVSALTLPKPPDNLVVQSVGTDYSRATVSFDPVDSASYYRIVAKDKNDNIVYNETVTDTVYQPVDGLDAGTMYTISVSGINASGEGTSRNAGYLSLPAAPGNFNSIQIEETAIKLGWESVTSATYFSLNRNGRPVYEGPELQFSDSGLDSGTIYNYSLRAFNEAGEGEKSVLDGLITLPGHIQNLHTSDYTTNSLLLTWDEVRGATRYVIMVNGKLYKTVPAGQPSLMISDLASGTEYTFSVYAVNESGQGVEAYTSGTTIPDQVSAINATDIQETAGRITWEPVLGANRYRITVGDKMFEVAGNFYDIRGLTGSQKYHYSVEAGNESGYGKATEGDFLTLPYSPNNIEVTATTESSIGLKWAPVETASSYIVTMDGKVVGTPASAEITIEGLTDGSNHVFTIQAVNLSGESQKSIFGWMTKPIAPTVVWTNPNTYSTDVMWEPVNGAEEYIVERAETVIYRGKDTRFTLTGLSDGQEYDYTIRAVNANMVSSSKTSFGFKTLPRKPVIVTATEVQTATLTLDLSNTQMNGIDRYVIGRNGDVIATIPSSQKSYKDEGLDAGTAYTYSIQGQNKSGSGDAFSFKATTQTDPVNLKTVKVEPGTNQLYISWGKVKGAASYQIRNTVTGEVYTTSTTDVSVPNLNSGTNYSFEIAAVNINGVVSKSVAFTGLTKPAEPATASIGRVSDSSITIDLTQTSVQGADEFIIERGGKEIGRVSAGIDSYEEKGLEAGQVYTYVIKAGNKSGMSDHGFSLTAKTVPASIDKLAEATAVTENSATVSWDKVKGADGYRVFIGTRLITTTAETTATIDNLVSAKAYDNISIVAFNDAGDAMPIRVKEFETLPVIKGLDVISKPGTTKAKLSWTLPSKNEIFVLVYKGKEIYRGKEREFMAAGFTPGEIEEVYFYTENSRGDTSEAAVHSFLMVPAAPTDVKYQSAPYSVTIDLSGSEVKGAIGYVIERDGKKIAQTSVTSAVYVDTNLYPGQTYHYLIKSVNDSGISEEGHAVDVTTLPSGMKGVPTVGNTTTDEVNLTWEPVEGATGYKLYYDESLITETDKPSVNISGLESAHQYSHYRVIPYNQAGVGKGADVPVFVTLPDPNFTVNATGKSNTEVDFTWTLPSNNEIFVLSFGGLVIYRGKDQSFSWKDLKSGTAYQVEAWTENELGDRSDAKQITARTLGFLSPPSGGKGGGGGGTPSTSTPINFEKDVPPDLNDTPPYPVAPVVKQVKFVDIDNTFNKDQIEYLAQQGVIEGVTETRFEPGLAITRAEFTTLIIRLMGFKPVDYQNTFKDVKAEDWFAQFIAVGVANNVVSGMGAGVFVPNDHITREQASVILANVLKSMNASALSNGQEFVDQENISKWAEEKVKYLSQMEMVTGYEDRSFRPLNKLTRAEAAALIYRLIDVVNNKLKN